METTLPLWIGFNIFILAMLAVDLAVHRKKPHVISLKEAISWSLFWIALAFGFNVFIYFYKGEQSALDFLAGYLVEKSLSVDNLFVFLLIFSYFKTPEEHLHKVLFYGILGAVIMRALFIFGGIALIQQFSWLLYFMGALLIYMGVKISFKNEDVHPENNFLVNWCMKWMPITKNHHGDRLFVKLEGKRFATPLFLALLTVEFTDLLFAIDSIPAILAITLDPFIVYTSNIFAILGLRALFFALKGSLNYFHLLHYAIGAILVFIGIKMIVSPWWHFPTTVALGFIIGTLSLAIVLSLIFPKKEH